MACLFYLVLLLTETDSHHIVVKFIGAFDVIAIELSSESCSRPL